MTLELTKKELEALKGLVKTKLSETINLINAAPAAADAKELSDYYDTLYMIRQKLNKEQ